MRSYCIRCLISWKSVTVLVQRDDMCNCYLHNRKFGLISFMWKYFKQKGIRTERCECIWWQHFCFIAGVFWTNHSCCVFIIYNKKIIMYAKQSCSQEYWFEFRPASVNCSSRNAIFSAPNTDTLCRQTVKTCCYTLSLQLGKFLLLFVHFGDTVACADRRWILSNAYHWGVMLYVQNVFRLPIRQITSCLISDNGLILRWSNVHKMNIIC